MSSEKRLPAQRMVKVVGVITTLFSVLEFFDIVTVFGIAILTLMSTIELIGAGNYAFPMFAPLGILFIIGGAIKLAKKKPTAMQADSP